MTNHKLKYDKKDDLIYLFHHIHHDSTEHEVHHCGGKHANSNYNIFHCSCGLHRINKPIANGDTIDGDLNKVCVKIKFYDKCPDGGWHIESGIK